MRLAEQQPIWAVGFVDAVWWSRVAHPTLRAFAPLHAPLRLVEQTVPRGDPDPKALAWYGVVLRQPDTPDRIWLRFVDGRPVSGITTHFLAWASTQLAAEGMQAWIVVWENASWHGSRAVRQWVRTHNQQVKAGHIVGVRIILCVLPVKSPWLNPIEPQWAHAKRRVMEPARLLTADELETRICAVFKCPRSDHLSIHADVT